MTRTPDRAETFSGGVVVLLATLVLGTGAGIVNGIILARPLGSAQQGRLLLPSGSPFMRFWVPRPADVRFAVETAAGMLGRFMVSLRRIARGRA